MHLAEKLLGQKMLEVKNPETMGMVEKVARALCRLRVNGLPEGYAPGFIDRHVEENWRVFEADARTAIGAMRL